MADSDLLITISGAALSLLFYENVRSCGDQMGFLIGQTLEFSVKTYTDSDNQIETIKTHNNIEAVVTCPLPELLHDSVGRINKEKLKDFMRDKSKQVIGWFRFRRNTGLLPTMRDKLLHREFASYFTGGNGSKEEFFVTCLLNASTSNGRGTHKFKHVFLRRRRGVFEPVSVRVNNLGNESARGSDYKPIPIKRSSETPDAFTRLIESLNLDLMRTSGVESAISIQKTAEQYLNQLIPQLCESDLEVAELEKQVKEFKLNRTVKMNGSADKINRNEVEKDHVVKEGQKLKKLSPSRIESPDIDDRRTLKDSTTSHNAIHNPKNTLSYSEKNNQTKLRKSNTDHTSQEPLVNTVSEIKVNLTETMLRNRRFSNRESETVKESICKSETNESGVGRGRRHECHPGTRKTLGRTTSIPTRSSERSETLLRQESETNCMQNTSPVLYSQIAQKKVDLRKSNSTDNH